MSKFLTIPQWYDLNGALCTGYSANVGNANTPVYVKDGNIVAANKYGLQDVQGVIPADIKTTIDQTLYTIFRRTIPPATGYVTIGDISSKFLNLLSSYNLSGIYSVDGAETEGIYVLNSMSKYEKQGINYIYTDILRIDNSGTYKLSLYLRIYTVIDMYALGEMNYYRTSTSKYQNILVWCNGRETSASVGGGAVNVRDITFGRISELEIFSNEIPT